MKQISNADYDRIKRILNVFCNYKTERPLKREEARRQSVLLLRKFERNDKKEEAE